MIKLADRREFFFSFNLSWEEEVQKWNMWIIKTPTTNAGGNTLADCKKCLLICTHTFTTVMSEQFVSIATHTSNEASISNYQVNVSLMKQMTKQS